MENGERGFRFLKGVLTVTLLSVFIGACDSGGGGEEPSPTTTPVAGINTPTPVPETPTPVPDPKITPPPVVDPSLSLGAPTTNPVVLPPYTSTSSVRFSTIVRGNVKPSLVVLDEVDVNGDLITEGVAFLKDDGEGEDLVRGDQNYSGQILVGSATAAQRYYRARADLLGEIITSETGTLWISGCPAVARPSNPEKVVFDENSGAHYFADEVSVVFEKSIPPELSTINALVSDTAGAGSQVVGCIPSLNQYLIEIPENESLDDLNKSLESLNDRNEVVMASPNTQVVGLPKFSSESCDGQECQWYLDRIRAPEAWAIAGAGDEQIGVAVLDFGVDCSHPELDCDVNQSSEDIIDHGTGVASLIGARNNDGTDLVGVAWNTDLYPLSFLAEGGSQYKLSELITLSTAQENVRVINISAATFLDPGFQIRDAMCNAIDSGRLIVAAAGNAAQSADCRITRIFPAQYNNPNDINAICANGTNVSDGLIVVGATDEQNQLAEWDESAQCSNTEYVDLYAPGKGLYSASADVNSPYGSKDGTSFATPLAAGGAAVVWAADPTLSVTELHDLLIEEATVLDSASDDERSQSQDPRVIGQPLLNIYQAVGGEDAVAQNPGQQDTSPAGFEFLNVDDAALSDWVTSNTIEVQSIDSAVPIDIQGGYYAIDGGAYTSAAGMARLGNTITVQVKSASVANATREATLIIGDQQATFHVTTAVPVPEPDNFDFIDVDGAALNTPIISAPIQINNLPENTPIRIVGGEYSLQGEEGPFTNAEGQVSSSNNIVLRVQSSESHQTRRTAIVTIGEQSDVFGVTTEALDQRPENLAFQSEQEQLLNNFVVSNEIEIQGINASVPISVSGGMFSIDGTGFTSEATTVQAGQFVQVRHISANQYGTNAYTTLTVGSQSTTFRSSTIENNAPLVATLNITNAEDPNLNNTRVGQTLAFTFTQEDSENDPAGVPLIQWLRDGNPINDADLETGGATSETYTLRAQDSGHDISVQITPTTDIGRSPGVPAISDSITVINSAPAVNNIQIVDSNGGSIVVDDSLNVSYTYEDVDGDSEGDSHAQWFRNGQLIQEGLATAPYIVQAEDVGQNLTVSITPVAASGDNTANASESPVVVIGNLPPSISNITITDANQTPISERIPASVRVGETLFVSYNYFDTEGDLESIPNVQWLRDGSAIELNGTSLQYTVNAEDSASDLSVQIIPNAQTGSLQGAAQESATVQVNTLPVVTQLEIVNDQAQDGPALSEARVGEIIASRFFYSDAEQDEAGSHIIQWLRNGTAIQENATNLTYLIAQEDLNSSISYRIVPVASTGSSPGLAVESSTITIVNSAPTVANISLVNINSEGTPSVGDTLQANYSFTDVDGDLEGATSFTWFRNNETEIGNAREYQITEADIGTTLSVAITPRSSSGVSTGEPITFELTVSENSAPTAINVSISDAQGNPISAPEVNATLFGTYTFQDLDSDQEGTSTYRWLRNGVEIINATGTTYQLQTEDSGLGIQFEITPVATSGISTGTAVRSAIVGVANSAPVALNVTVVDSNGGVVEIGDTLTGSFAYQDIDGDAQAGTAFQWLRNGTIEVGTGQSYVVTPEDNGQSLSFNVTPAAESGTSPGETNSSENISVSFNAAPIASDLSIQNNALENITAAVVGTELRVSYVYSDAENDPENINQRSIQWLHNGAIIEGANSDTYIVQADESGGTISFTVIPTVSTGYPTGELATSPAITINNSAPTIDPDSITLTDSTGEPLLVEDTLTVSYIFSDVDGDQEGQTSFQWTVNGNDVIGATTHSYLVQPSDSGLPIAVRITPVAATGETNGEAITSSSVTVGNTAPSISNLIINESENGIYAVGDSLSVSYSYNDLEEDPEGETRYQWQRNGADIETNGTGASYLLTNADSGASIRVIVTPVAEQGTEEGSDVQSAAVTINAIPAVSSITISDSSAGEIIVGDTLTVSYVTTDAEEPENTSANLQWVRLGIGTEPDLEIPEATSASYLVSSEDSGHELMVHITPVATTGSSPGISVETNAGIVVNSPPQATNVFIEDDNGGEVEIGDPLYGRFTIEDPDNDPINEEAITYRWLRGTTVVGTENRYDVTEADNGQTLVFEVTPVASEGTINGDAVESAPVTVVLNAPPEASDVQIIHERESNPVVGDTLSGSYVFTDAEDDENASTYSWFNNGTIILNEQDQPYAELTYELRESDIGDNITFQVTPRAASGVSTGTPVTSAAVIPEAIDTAPNALSFSPASETPAIPGSTDNDSNTVTVEGFNTSAAISVTGGSYRIQNTEGEAAEFVTTPGSISPGQLLTLRLVASEGYGETTTMGVTIDTANYLFSVTTIQADTTPDDFELGTLTDEPINTPFTSTITVQGIDIPVPISIDGGEYQIGENDPTSAAGIVDPDTDVIVHLNSSPDYGATTTATLNVNGVQSTFSITTLLTPPDSVPDPFSIDAIPNAFPGEPHISNRVIISGINVDAEITVGEGGLISVGTDDEFTSETQTIRNNQAFYVQTTPTYYDDEVIITVTVGGVSAPFVVTTGNRPDYDIDDDGLIEINRLQDLNEIRNNLTGTGLFGSSNGCPIEGCIGFELTTDLDFDTNGDGQLGSEDLYWNGGEGWVPLAPGYDFDSGIAFDFTAVLEGNGFFIANLFINRPESSTQSLIGWLWGATVRNLVLNGEHGYVVGFSGVGSLASYTPSSRIEQVMSSVIVESTTTGIVASTGGLIGSFGGETHLVNVAYTGSVSSSEADGHVGGLAGGRLGSCTDCESSTVINSYSSAAVSYSRESKEGGLLGGSSSTPSDLVAVTEGYWLTRLSGNDTSYGGSGVTLEQFQCRSESNLSADCTEAPLSSWEAAVDANGSRIWDLGMEGEMPGLVMNGRIYRDSDADGAISIYTIQGIHGDDDLPNEFAVIKDSDFDGSPDRWSWNCDEACRLAYGLTYDRFPLNPSFSIDDDWDGVPDFWNPGCEGGGCENPRDLQPEPIVNLNDTDNDEIPNEDEADADGDGVLDVDRDSDSLIDISTIEQLNAIRHDLDGRAYFENDADSEGDDSGCLATIFQYGYEIRSCLGYELVNDLDFDSNGNEELSDEYYWNDGQGWEPIGGGVGEYFSAIFDGNGFVINNLFVNRPESNYQGLFGKLNDANVRNLILTGEHASITGDRFVGSLAGFASNSYVENIVSTVEVGSINASSYGFGGLLGNGRGNLYVVNTIYTGAIESPGSYLGGLLGSMYTEEPTTEAAILNSYSSATVTASSSSNNVGGLVGATSTNIVVAESYWLTDRSGSLSSAGGTGVTTDQFQCRNQTNTIEDCPDAPLASWELETNDQGDWLWDFGDGEVPEFPGMLLNGRLFREVDGEITIEVVPDILPQ